MVAVIAGRGHRAGLGLAVAAVTAAAAGCAGSSNAADPTTPSTVVASPTHSAPAPQSPQQLASQTAYHAYVGDQADTVDVVESTRDDQDPRLRRHAASSELATGSEAVDYFVRNGWGVRGYNRVDLWKPVSFYPRTGKPIALTATACLDSSSGRIYDRRTGEVAPQLKGHQRLPALVRAQTDNGVWKVVWSKLNLNGTC
jgi:hypothetical protein